MGLLCLMFFIALCLSLAKFEDKSQYGNSHPTTGQYPFRRRQISDLNFCINREGNVPENPSQETENNRHSASLYRQDVPDAGRLTDNHIFLCSLKTPPY